MEKETIWSDLIKFRYDKFELGIMCEVEFGRRNKGSILGRDLGKIGFSKCLEVPSFVGNILCSLGKGRKIPF